jgi:Uri superfamily endonuclease
MYTSEFNQEPVFLLGKSLPGGVYLLGIQLARQSQIVFGRHNQGKPIPMPEGSYLYIGSAYGQKGSSTLAARLMRHTCRSSGKPPHHIQLDLLKRLQAAGLLARVPKRKTPHWHIDYLLEEEQAQIFTILAYRTNRHLEQKIAATLAAMPETVILSPGLGASDHPGGTHLLMVRAADSWWQKLPDLFSQAEYL